MLCLNGWRTAHCSAAGRWGARDAASWRSAGPTLLITKPFSSVNVGLNPEFISLFNQPTSYIFISGGSVECSDKSEHECVSKTIDGDDNDSDDAKLFKKLVNEGGEPGTDYSNNDQRDETRRGKIGTL